MPHVHTDLQALDSYAKTFLYVPPFFLKAGVYRFTFSITLRSPDNSHPLLPFEASAETHVTVVPSPIIGQMTDGAQSRVVRAAVSHFLSRLSTRFSSAISHPITHAFQVRGWGQRVRFAPGNFSIDPDDANNKNFTITWFCRRLPGETLERDIPDEQHAVSGPIMDRAAGQLPSDDDNDDGAVLLMTAFSRR